MSIASGIVGASPGKVLGGTSAEELEALYRSERDRMVRMALLLVGSAADAEELVQESFVRVASARRPIDNLPAYLRTTVVNLSRSHLRRLRVQRRQPATPPRLVEDPELDETWDAVCRLPFRQRAAVVLRYYQDLSEAEIARLLDCRPGTVKSNLHHALARLRKELP
ncbi:MAG: SigE family RNA polymerase sigma factor [Acidimicrobiales bacterium]